MYQRNAAVVAIVLVFVILPLTLQGQESTEKFTPLFDGKSLAGWKTNEKTSKSWSVADGMLVLKGGNNHLFTEKEFDNFVVRLEWRPKKKGYNSGFYIRGKNQINLAQKDAGRLFGYKNTKPVPDLHNPPGEWNTWEITCDGPNVTLRVNDKLAWSIDNFKPKKGVIGIQAEGQAIDFRKVEIRELKK